MILSENDLEVLGFISNETNSFTQDDIDSWLEIGTAHEVNSLRNLMYECSDYDYDFEDSYVQIQLTQIKGIILF